MSIDATSAQQVREALESTTRRQRDASDPAASAWVSANAGTGKTHVLTMRTLRLMLAGTPPERILCLTYTKAAAAEMSTRVFGRLAKWVTATDDALSAELDGLLGRRPTLQERLSARTLFTRAIETPGGLKVQTIHAFCERLLQRFPMEAGVPPGFSTLDDDLGRTLKREAIDRALAEALADKDGPLGRALMTAVAYAAEDMFEDVLSAAIKQRSWLLSIERQPVDLDGPHDPLIRHAEVLRHRLGGASASNLPDLHKQMAGVLSDAVLDTAARVLGEGTKTDQKVAVFLRAAHAAGREPERIAALKSALLTQKGEPRASVATKKVRESEPGLTATLETARDRLAKLAGEELALKCVDATLALIQLASRVLQHYNDAKARRAALDFDDLIEKAVSLLGSGDGALAQTDWVLYKLDGGIDHILVDESQDTSPEQWRIVESLANEFFSGEGAHDTLRTLFAVGDEKQSIYSFQGAAPEMFARMGAQFKQLANDAGQELREVPLDLSFRTVAPVLGAVDSVFEDESRTPGLSGEDRTIHHAVKRLGEAGLVEIWPTEKPEDPDKVDAFSPLDEHPSATPVERLAARIADQIGEWIERGEMLPAKGRPIRPGDILILCRKRKPFAEPMVAALKARKIPVAGTDRLVLTQQLGVKDLMALGDFTTLPEDDLTLAALLKSPLVGLDDDDLFDLAYQRKTSLWKSLIDKRGKNPRYEAAVSMLVALRKRADFLPPFEFYAKALDEDGLRKRLLARLGHEAADPIDEFLSLAIAFDDREAPSLTGFLAWLRDGTREIKRDMEQGADQVRVMTVHASKGLESPIVFLPDTCSTASAGGARDPITKLLDENLPDAGDHGITGQVSEPPRTWTIKGASRIDAISQARSSKADGEQEELNRLLYVAMTRAEDRLYVAGFEGLNARPSDCWYDSVIKGLDGQLTRIEREGGSFVLRLESEQLTEPSDDHEERPGAQDTIALPDWAGRAAPVVRHVALPLAPSQLAPYEADAEGEPVVGPAIPDETVVPEEPPADEPLAATGQDDRFLRGNLTHALLENLPAIPPEKWDAAAGAFLELRGPGLSARVRQTIIAELKTVLNHPQFTPIFGPRSRAEVAITADLPRPNGKGPNLRLAGMIDRLAEVDGTILIVDYKTNRNAPGDETGVADAYLLQLAAYRLALGEIYPCKQIRAALLWTRTPRLIEISEPTMDAAQARLWELSAE
ncbi:MAG: double-strand break repair helicase AddA [Alphaproteobacteria bacterium]|nr:double-strand break repair helicase AddA [Alphaproteobacteria bacterium]